VALPTIQRTANPPERRAHLARRSPGFRAGSLRSRPAGA